MHDLYINFCGALENLDGDLKLSRSEDRALDKDNFLRFTHSVAELQHLGIISPAMNHRPEHYERTMLITRDQLDSVDL